MPELDVHDSAPDMERLLARGVGIFTAAYAAVTIAPLGELTRYLIGPGAALVVALVGGSILAALVLAVRGTTSRTAWALPVLLHLAADAVWPAFLVAPVATGEPPWLIGISPVLVLQLLLLTRSARLWAASFVLLDGLLVLQTSVLGGAPLEAVLRTVLLVLPIPAVLGLLALRLRQASVRLAAAKERTLARFADDRLAETTAGERARTDALVHDIVLTTLLQATAAADEDGERLAVKMALNALRVLDHVGRQRSDEEVIRFGARLAEHVAAIEPLLARFAVLEHARDVEDLLLPRSVADGLLVATEEAMRSSVDDALATSRTLQLSPLGPDGLRIAIFDDDGAVERHGPRETVVRRRLSPPLSALEGRVDVHAVPEHGFTVTLSWGSVVVVDVRLIETRLEEVQP